MSQLPISVRKIKSTHLRYRYLFLLATVFGGSLIILSINNRTEIFLLNQPLWNQHRFEIVGSEETFTIKTSGCSIPGMKAFDEGVKKFVKKPTEIKPCTQYNNSLLESNETHIWINKAILQLYDVSNDANVTCCYKPFYRPSAIADIFATDIDDRVEYETCTDFDDIIQVTDEFVKVSCGYNDEKPMYEQYFLFAIMKPITSSSEESDLPQNQSAYNVLIMGIDAVSRLNFHRTMPKTLKYLKKKGAIELLGYNKVGDNTFPNLTPMLLGIRDTDLKRTCWPSSRSTFDNCPFVWEWYKDAGFYTALGEDSAILGTFNYEKFGFSGTPTDYYLHTFIHEAEVTVGNNKDFNTYICMGNKYFYQVLLDYVESLTRTLRSSKLFGFFWEVTMSHDYLNYPMHMDNSYNRFLEKLDNSKYLDDTILLLVSDHGIRWGDIRYTKQGRLEERLPFVYMLLPPSFKKNFNLAYNNLKINSKRLTTPFDIYATLIDLSNLDSIKDAQIQSRTKTNYAQGRSISLFMPIQENRTCKAADIDDHWCTCHKSNKLSKDSEEASDAAAHLVDYLNTLLEGHRECLKLTLNEVLEVTELVSGTPDDDEVGWREFMVVVRTEPGSGVFEATLRRKGTGWAVAGTVSRLNLYGDQSRCVHDYQLKLYCFCR